MASDTVPTWPVPCRPRCAVGPGEERQDRARPAELVAEVEVVAAGVVEVHGQLHQAEAQGAGVEIEVPLRIARDGGDVMNAHATTPSFRQRFPRARCSSWVSTASCRVMASACPGKTRRMSRSPSGVRCTWMNRRSSTERSRRTSAALLEVVDHQGHVAAALEDPLAEVALVHGAEVVQRLEHAELAGGEVVRAGGPGASRFHRRSLARVSLR